jgi:hypothetical protein
MTDSRKLAVIISLNDEIPPCLSGRSDDLCVTELTDEAAGV